jgi:hypothetical protein
MKQLIIILVFPIISFSQTVNDTCFTEQQIHEISETLDDLYFKDSINTELIIQQSAVIDKQDQLIKLDSIQLVYKQQQIDLLETNINLYIKQQKKLQPNWYNNKTIWFAGGILTTILTSKLIVLTFL